MSTLFSRFSGCHRVMGFILILSLAGIWLWIRIPRQVLATEVPFGEKFNVSTDFDGAQSAAAADLDRDGDLDIVAAAKNAGDIVWWENTTGDGTSWGVPKTITNTLDGAIDAVPADLDGDGDLDILGASSTTGEVWWWDNASGDGSTWNAALVDSTFSQISGITVADVDGDGDRDGVGVGSVSGSVQVHWFENTVGDGSAWSSLGVAVALSSPTSVAMADLDRDGDLDIVAAFQTGNEISWWRNNNGDGSSWSPFTISSTYDSANGIEISDIDRDGDPDVLAAYSNGTLSWRENDGTGQVWADHPITTTFSGAVSVAAADLDGDGDQDVLGAGTDQTRWWENTDGAGSTWEEYPIDTAFSGARAIGAADVDGDGSRDVIGAAETADDVVWWQNKTIHRNAYYPIEGSIQVDGNFDGAISITSADFDRDGDPDILAGAYNTGEVAWYKNNTGDGTNWIKESIDNTLSSVRSVYTADLDGDGDLDALAADTIANEILWWANNGSGSFGTAQTVDVNFTGAFWVSAGDVDGDGDIDILGAGGTLVSWWENTDGNGAFGTRIDIAPGYDAARSVSAADFDRDDDLDVLASSYNENDISWWENENGDGSSWAQQTVDNAIDNPVATFAADVDGDGDMDVLGASELDDELSWWENDGNGAFGSRQTIGTGFDSPSAVLGADLDRDGDEDVIGAARNNNILVWFENDNGDGSGWTEHILISTFQEAVAVHVADINRDGAPDILGAAFVEDTLRWWENRGGQFSMNSMNTSPAAIADGTTTDVMAITVTHQGRPNDSEMKLATLEFLFEESPGNGMGSPEANAVIENLHIYLDDGSESFDSNDTLVMTVDTITLVSGFETIQLPTNDPNVKLNPGETKTFFIVLELTANAGAQDPNQILLTHLTLGPLPISSAVDTNNDIPLQMAYEPDLTVQLIAFAPDLFIGKFANNLPGDGLASPETLSGGADTIQPGDLITYTILFSNTGNANATNVFIIDPIPMEAQYTGSTSTGVATTLSELGNNTYRWDIGTLPGHANGAITIMAALDPGVASEYAFVNTAYLTGTLATVVNFGAASSASLEINFPPSVDAGADQTVLVGQSFEITALYSDPGLDDTHQATIDWGDGNETAGVVDPVAHTVKGSHTYLSIGTFNITVSVKDNDGGQGVDIALYTVNQGKTFLPVILKP